MSSVPKRASYDDIRALPQNVVGQIVDGELVVSPRPASDHAVAAGAVQALLWSAYSVGRDGPGGWWVLFEPEVHLGNDVLVPDVAGWVRGRMPVLEKRPWFELSPDWVCEVLSTSTARVDRIRKLPIYAREGVGHVWLVDPAARTVEVFRRDGSNWLLVQAAADTDKLRAEPFAQLELPLPLLWGEVPGATP